MKQDARVSESEIQNHEGREGFQLGILTAIEVCSKIQNRHQ